MQILDFVVHIFQVGTSIFEAALVSSSFTEDVVEILTTIQLERNVRACVLQVNLSSVAKIIIII